MERKPLQQGDVLINPIYDTTLLQNLKKVEKKPRGFVLAEGETTGHAHVIDEDVELYEDDNGDLYLRALKDAAVVHEEHATIEIPPGWYEIGIVQEVDPFTEQIRKVVD